ncbi:dual specificity protein kinase splB-like isoform X2 [Diorhabda sublineata]|uniref:dual specificity protein kinase splB-like isoform X2 n=1 Tax=Diorhabda sublineata TaxID=1163346 RepID=UPI0024E11AE3|nr:dual specificity protein kinase splB-like isoform X2 [Diorhabda sublineata]
MKGVIVLFFLGLCTQWVFAVFLNHRPFPTYSLENMPSTGFSCRDKILGGYYADAETQCQMFHICVKVAGVGVQDFRFLCPNGTAFDQDHQICAEWEDIDCDATTLYYSSDNFDLYRIGSGYESKAHRYGEDEETFSLQRAETGDARINHDQQTKIVDQTKTPPRSYQNSPRQSFNNNNNNNEKDIFKGSSSSNFYNNRNNGKERDEDYDDNININQNRDYERKRKVVRNRSRRPVQNENKNNQINEFSNKNQESRSQTRRPVNQNTRFVNNFAGSYEPSTTKPSTTTPNANQYTTTLNNYRNRNGQRRQQFSDYTDSPTFTISTPAPFKQQYNTPPSRSTGNVFATEENTSKVYETTKVKQIYDKTENYPNNNPKYSTSFDKKQTTSYKQTNPSTLSPKPFSVSNSNFPTTFAPRTNAAYSQIAQQTAAYNQNRQSSQNSPSSTPKSTPFTQYTPTVPKISSTTPISRSQFKLSRNRDLLDIKIIRSSRFDETQYDDGSYSSKYDYDGDKREDEFLKTAHSQNIAASRNELQKTTNNKQTQTTVPVSRSTYEVPKTYPSTKKVNNDVTKTSVSTSKVTESPKTTSKTIGKKPAPPKKDYDYAYYDTGVGSEPDYDIHTEIKKLDDVVLV